MAGDDHPRPGTGPRLFLPQSGEQFAQAQPLRRACGDVAQQLGQIVIGIAVAQPLGAAGNSDVDSFAAQGGNKLFGVGEIGAGERPRLLVLNKADRAPAERLGALAEARAGCVVVSALSGEGLDRLLAEMTDEVAELVLRNNYLQSQAISTLEARATERLAESAAVVAEQQAELSAADAELSARDAEVIQLQARGQQLESLEGGRPEMQRTLQRAERFLSLVALLAAMVAAGLQPARDGRGPFLGDDGLPGVQPGPLGVGLRDTVAEGEEDIVDGEALLDSFLGCRQGGDSG